MNFVFYKLKWLLHILFSAQTRCALIIMDLPCWSKILLLNINMLCDTEQDHDNLDMYLDVLSEIRLMHIKCVDISRSIIGGDFNTDLSHRSSLHNMALLDYLPREGLMLCSQYTNDEILYAYENSFTGGQSVLDRFVQLCHYIWCYWHSDQITSILASDPICFGCFPLRGCIAKQMVLPP